MASNVYKRLESLQKLWHRRSSSGFDPLKPRGRSYVMVKRITKLGNKKCLELAFREVDIQILGSSQIITLGDIWECFWTVYLEDFPNKPWPVQLHSHPAQCSSLCTPVVTCGNQRPWKYTDFKM